MADTTVTSAETVISRGGAKAAGLTRYYTGKPCPAGHISEHLVSNASCVACRAGRVRTNERFQPDANDAGTYDAFKARQRVHPHIEERTARIRTIFDEYRDQGFTLSVRQVYYQFVSRGWEVNDDKAYHRRRLLELCSRP
jgi:hypothetical protein